MGSKGYTLKPFNADLPIKKVAESLQSSPSPAEFVADIQPPVGTRISRPFRNQVVHYLGHQTKELPARNKYDNTARGIQSLT
jgi:hypothetical protein